MNRKTFALATLAFAILALNACSSSKSEGYENSVTLLNRESAQEQIKASDNGYCPLLPYPHDPRTPDEKCVKDSEGNKECFGDSFSISDLPYISEPDYFMPDSAMLAALKCKDREEREELEKSDMERGKLSELTDFSYCDKIDEAQIGSIEKAFNDLLKEIEEKMTSDWDREVQRMRNDPARTAALAFSKSQTTIKLSPLFVEAILSTVQLEDTKRNDTLFIKVVRDADGGYDRMRSMSKCPISLDIAINRIDKDIAVVVFEDEQIFQAEYE